MSESEKENISLEEIGKREIESMTKKIYSDMDENLIDKSLQSNELEFEVDHIKYRVRKPTFSEKQNCENARLKKFNELIKKDEYMFEESLISILKNKGIDIKAMDDQIRKLESDKQTYQYKLGKGLVDNIANNEVEELRTQIIELTNLQQYLIVKKNNYLEFSIENQMVVFVYLYLTSLITEQKDGEEWVRVWKDLNELQSCENESLIRQATFCATLITRNEIEG